MKRLLLVALLTLSTLGFGQNNLNLLYSKDVMTDKEYISSSKTLLCSDDGKKGFFIEVLFNIKNGVVSYSTFYTKSSGVGGCMENDELIFLFEDDTKLVVKSWQKFNCKGTSYFDLYGKLITNLNKKIKAIRLTNGRSFESFTYLLKTEDEKNYFIYINELLVNQKYEIK